MNWRLFPRFRSSSGGTPAHLTERNWAHKDPLYFLHIPKTAGTTFQPILTSYFDPHTICPAYDWAELLQIPVSALAGYRLFRGHFYGHLRHLLKRQTVTITFLRDPTERTISQYAHTCRSEQHWFYLQARSSAMGEYLRNPEVAWEIVNFQTRCLAAEVDVRAVAEKLGSEAVHYLKLEPHILAAMATKLRDRSLLSRAKERLDQFPFVGIAERFDESIRLLCQTFGWKPPPKYESLNIAVERPKLYELPQSTIDALREANDLDFELYDYAKKLFIRRLEQMTRPVG
jgi:hypothetical protein